MKKVFFSVAALAAAMSFTACSSEDGLEQAQAPVWNADGTGYMAFNISMPKDNGDRANDNFDQGSPEEYAVNNAILLLFDGTTEGSAQFHSAYDLTDDGTGWGTAQGGNITVDKKYIAKVEGAPTNPKAFVVLNHNGYFTVDNATHSLKVNSVPFPVGQTFADLQAKTVGNLSLNADAFRTNGILMMNAPLYDKPGDTHKPSEGGSTLSVLAPVYGSNVYATEELAKNGTSATNVYVERAVAKVTVKEKSTVETPTHFSVSFNGWTLDNTNKTSYLVRSIDGFLDWIDYKATNDKYRMVGHTSLKHSAPISNGTADEIARYRTYFAKDTNYNTEAVYGTTFNNVYEPTTVMGQSQYCAENTFDVERMTYKNTTRVLLKTTIAPTEASLNNGGAGFYSRPGDDKFYTAEQMETVLHNKVNSKLANLKEEGKLTGSGDAAFTISTTDYKTFTVKVENIAKTSSITGDDETLVDELIAGTKTYSIHEIGYDFYAGGVAYYDVRIKHFGDDLTKWNTALNNVTNVNEAYGSPLNEEAYLGRWGVLRNNWYELEVGSVKKIGYAHPENLSFDPSEPLRDPEYGDTPDDNQKSEQWIAVDVNILSWAKRSQSFDL